MTIDKNIIKNDEKAIYGLRSLYQKYGYKHYKMSKFEEYDLYVKNKDFLVSNEIITFTDTNGKLLALKPDVTLSIIKNTKDAEGCVQKVYYNENVYRVSKGSGGFKEIMQTGLECIGDIGAYEIFETLMLAIKSLEIVSENYILDISHMGILSALLDGVSAGEDVKSDILHCIGQKNTDGIKAICEKHNIGREDSARLFAVVSTYGSIPQVLPKLASVCENTPLEKPFTEFSALCKAVSESGYGDKVNIDFSIINDMNYYSGVVFRGYIEGIPAGVLSGGQYDKLMHKMGRSSGAVGFAVYLDLLERFNESGDLYDYDFVLIYESGESPQSVMRIADALTADGNSVFVALRTPDNMKYKKLGRAIGGRFVIIEENN